MSKARVLVIIAALALAGGSCFASSVYLTANAAADFMQSPSARQVIEAFSSPEQPLFEGFAWEVVVGNVGFGSECLVNFFRDGGSQWWLDWYCQAFFISYHAFGTWSFIDPYVQLGLGCAGRVLLDEWAGPYSDCMLLSIMPCMSAGLNIKLDTLLLGAKVTWTPVTTPPPATEFQDYPLGTVQCTLSAGVALGGKIHRSDR